MAPAMLLPLLLAAAPQVAATLPQVPQAKKAILFVGDGMGIPTITATRIFSVGADGELTMDTAPYTALLRTHSADHLVPDSASTMTAMMTGVNPNSGVLGLGPGTERGDFLGDGDTAPLPTLLELAEQSGRMVGIVTTARLTHATPAACYAKSNSRTREELFALNLLPGDPAYDVALGSGVDVLFGGGRRWFVPDTVVDEEGDLGWRTDGRDLRAEFQAAGYAYVWEKTGFDALTAADLPVLGLFESSHMEYEYDRPTDLGGEPSLAEMTAKAIELLDAASPSGWFLVVEGGRIDHAHHAGNAFRALVETEALDLAVAAALQRVDLQRTLVVVTADHGHTFTLGGYALRPEAELPYPVASAPTTYLNGQHGNVLNTVFDVDTATGDVVVKTDLGGVPYTALLYANGPGHRSGPRVDPWLDGAPGFGGAVPNGPEDPNYLQEAVIPLSAESHGGADVLAAAWGVGALQVRGVRPNTHLFTVFRVAMRL